ncbi:MAG: GH1 family beta-glucosidase [Bacteroidota bacterium]
MGIVREDFGPGFKWGVSTSAYQVEGACDLDGKGKSVWDVFSNTRGKIKGNQNGNIACDFYRLYPDDLALLNRLNVPNFRFSLSWSRIIPQGTGLVNRAGIDFYNRIIDHCLKFGIEPWITLYHWDLPYELEKRGGWTNRDIIGWFTEYVIQCISHFGNRVKHWMILNEPMVFTGTGYFLGIHAPGRKGLNSFLAAIHHAAMCQAEGGRIIRSFLPKASVGTTFSCSLVHPLENSAKHLNATVRVDALLNRLFIEPLSGMGYPLQDLPFLQRLEPYIMDGDEARLVFEMDFIGVQNYTREIIARSRITPFIWAKVIKAGDRNAETTEMNWEVYPESIYHMLHKFSKYSVSKEIIVTENGAAFQDSVMDGRVPDENRKSYLKQYISQVFKAKQEGVRVNGYFVWSITDNFEWAEGYMPRFGLVYVDFLTQQRIIKDSGYWYSRFLQNEETL